MIDVALRIAVGRPHHDEYSGEPQTTNKVTLTIEGDNIAEVTESITYSATDIIKKVHKANGVSDTGVYTG